MAVADGRLRDRAGVAMVSRGPGLSNAMVSLHSAYHDATPVVMLVGQVERKDFGRLALQEQNYSRLLVRRHQAGHRGQRAGAGLGGDRPRLPCRRERHPGPGRGDPAGGHLRRGDRRRTRTRPRPRVVAGPRAEDLDRLAGMLAAGRAAAGAGRRARCWPMRSTTRRSSPISTGSPRNGCCRSARPIAGRNCSTRRIRISAAIWGSACRRR